MKTSGVSATHPTESSGVEAREPEIVLLEDSLQQIADRASAKTEVLREMLDQPRYERSPWSHWGINE